MSKSSLSLTKAKEIAINFVKKYKDSLRDGETCKRVNDDDIARYEAMTPAAFFDADILANFGFKFNLFAIRRQKSGNRAMIWMGKHTDINDLAKNIIKHRESDKVLLEYWQMDGAWYNLTEARIEALEEIFDQLGVKSKTHTAKKPVAKKPAKKPAKKAEPKHDTFELSDVVTIKNDVAFIDTDNYKFDHLVNLGGNNVDMCIYNKSELNASNQIDHVINAFKVAKKEIDVLINELVKAKEAGAKNVVDADWCTVRDFDFDN